MSTNLVPSTSLFSILLLGISMGMTACTVTCLPFLGTWALGREGSVEEGAKHTVYFLAGRIVAYACLGALAAALGEELVSVLNSGLGNTAVGLAALVAAAYLLVPHAPTKPCAVARNPQSLPPFLLGFALSLTPCVPLATLLALCALTGNAWTGMHYGLTFGLGAVVTPILILVPLLAHFGIQLRQERQWLGVWLRWAAALVLGWLGLRRLSLVEEITPEVSVVTMIAATFIIYWLVRSRRYFAARVTEKTGMQTTASRRIAVVMVDDA